MKNDHRVLLTALVISIVTVLLGLVLNLSSSHKDIITVDLYLMAIIFIFYTAIILISAMKKDFLAVFCLIVLPNLLWLYYFGSFHYVYFEFFDLIF